MVLKRHQINLQTLADGGLEAQIAPFTEEKSYIDGQLRKLH